MCDAPYTRPSGLMIRCTYLRDHPTERHSWFAVQCQDSADREPKPRADIDYGPAAIRSFLGAIARGDVDIYLEAILAITHERKRTLRGVRTFASLMEDPQ